MPPSADQIQNVKNILQASHVHVRAVVSNHAQIVKKVLKKKKKSGR